MNSWMIPGFNIAVYKAGLASTQEDYETNARIGFETLDRLEMTLADHQRLYLLETPNPTEVDIKLYTTIERFDVIYQQHFKLMTRSIRHGYPRLGRWLKSIYWNVAGVKETTNFEHIKENYSKSHIDINPKSIIPLGPEPDVGPWTAADEAWYMQETAGLK
ncbi:hypothetical protein N7G274_008360 [Stereocaulon virgatum]|uniref:Glutathione S-transferase n=1 Tax=Stereocaulon virgatum TaxID=373712 RepID=A0ABR4A1C3_9LECA